MPNVRVLYFAQVRERLNHDEERFDFPDTITATTVLAAVSKRHPQHETLLARCRVALDHQFLTGDAAVHAHSELALIPPVSGG